MQTELSAEDVTVVSVCFNSSEVLDGMLASVPEVARVILVDNASQDIEQTAAIARKHGADLIRNRNNLGFGAACNRGADLATTEFLLFLNPDARLEDGALDALLRASERHPDTTAFNPRFIRSDGRPYLKRRSVLLPRKHWLKRGGPDRESRVPVLSGAAIFVRRKVFGRIAFDPKIFLFHEDDDWSYRMREAGHDLVFVPDAVVRHDPGNSTERSREVARFKAFHLGKSRVFVMQKHDIPLVRVRSTSLAVFQLFNPLVLLSGRKRARQLGFLRGVSNPRKTCNNIRDLPDHKIIPWWKLKREVNRLVRQIAGMPKRFFNRYLVSIWYDRVSRRALRVHDGAVPTADKVVVYLVYPKNGILPSHRKTLDAILDAGYAPLVISNLPLSEDDLATLRKSSWKVIERPNVGYDFGGYRDGILHLKDNLPKLKRLVLLNDSSWFPLPGTENWITEAENLGPEFVGAATSFGIPRVSRDRYQAIEWKYDVNLKDFHYSSYALSIGPKILADPKFFWFWKRYKLTNIKNRVVRWGEMGLSRWVISQGYSHGSTYDLMTLPGDLQTCPDAEINRIANELIYLGDAKMDAVLNGVLPQLDATRSLDERAEMELLILATVARFGVSYVIPRLLYEKRGFAFLKKSPVALHKGNSDIMLEIGRDLSKKDDGLILDEMMAIRRERFPQDQSQATSQDQAPGSERTF